MSVSLFVAAFGGLMVDAFRTNAQDNSPSVVKTQFPNTPVDSEIKDQTKGSHVGANGVREVELLGETLEKVKAAALAAVPGGTILRAETDAEGSPYEAHMRNAEGAVVTVKIDSNFYVTNIETGRK
jgi:hypothetical protein